MSTTIPELFYTDQSNRGKLRLTGRDRQSFLQGMVSNDVAALTPGTGCYSFLLDATGHILADARILCRDNSLLLDLEPDMAPFVAQTLDRYLIMEKCRITDITGELTQVFVGGTSASAFLETLGFAGTEHWGEGQNDSLPFAGTNLIATAMPLTPSGGFALLLPNESDGNASAVLQSALTEAHAVPIADSWLDALRIEAGIPRFGQDMDSRVLAPESGQQHRAISYRKGCYIGQEIVARIHARGHTNRTLAGFIVEGKTPVSAEATVLAEGKEVGRITSSALSPTLGTVLALGYLRHEAATPGNPVEIEGRHAHVSTLPFVQP